MKSNEQTTLKNIADDVGVSITTVSRVLSGKASTYRISKETEKAICETAKKLNYEPNQVARGLRLRRTHTIGLTIPDISNPFFASIARSIEIEARKAGYSIMVCDSQEDTVIEIDSVKLLRKRKVDGMIISPVGQDIGHIERLYKNGIPIVVIDRYFEDLKCPHVVSDNYGGAKDAVTHFIENGHRVIACIQGIPHTSVNEDRIKGYQDAHKKHHIPVDESLIVGDNFGELNGYIGVKLLLNRLPQLTAIFATSNLISLGALRAISEEGLMIPDDISIIAFDDQPYSDFLATPMTTVAQQKTEMGNIAIKLLMDQIEFNDRFENRGVLLPTKMILRESVKKLN